MADLAYDDAVRDRLDAIERERAEHRVVLATASFLRCRCGEEGSRADVTRHLYELGESWVLPPGVRTRHST